MGRSVVPEPCALRQCGRPTRQPLADQGLSTHLELFIPEVRNELQRSAECRHVPFKHITSRDITRLDLGNTADGHSHSISHLKLSQAPPLSHVGHLALDQITTI